MKTFSERLINHLTLENDISEIHKLNLIVPSQRSKWEISKSFKTIANKPFILPKIDTIHDFILKNSKLGLIDSYEAQIIFCKIATSIDKKTSAEIIYKKSNSIIKEFNSIESYLIDSNKLFYELSNISDIENWSLNENDLSKNQLEFISQFNVIGNIFSKFKSTLLSYNKAIYGTIYREVAENCDTYFSDKKNIYFVGLNALSKSEEIIVNYLVGENLANVFHDSDKYYAFNKNHEAGYFFRKHQYHRYNKPIDYIENSQKEVLIHESPTSIKQIEIVKSIILNNNEKKFTIVLMDESLGPFIYESLIKVQDDINYSSGLDISHFESAKLLQFFTNDFPTEISRTHKIDYTTFKKILNYQILRENLYNFNELEKKFENKKSFKISIQNIIWKNKDFEKLINIAINLFDVNDFFDQLNDLINSLLKIYFDNKIQCEVLSIIKEQYQNINSKCTKHNFDLNSQQVINTLNTHIDKIKIALKGNKIAKIQILGLLESRTIDVENIIYVSCNEDFLPKKDLKTNLIPNDLRNHYGLPTKYEKEALFAYYFYRSLQYAKNIHLIKIIEGSNGLEYNETSRYIKQIEVEFKALAKIKIDTLKYESSTNNESNYILNNENIKLSITNWMESGISPSSLLTFSNCSLSFYYKYVLKIKEEQSPKNFLNNSEWGSAIHKTLENLYSQYEYIDSDKLKKMLNILDKFMDNEFYKIFDDKRYLKGKNGLIYYHYKKCIENFIRTEISDVKNFGSYRILELEKELSYETKIQINGSLKNIKFKGIIDRIDSTASGIRLVDYKSGLVRPNELALSSIEQVQKRDKAFQLLFYAMLFAENFKSNKSISGQIISIKNTKQHKLNLTIDKKDNISNENLVSFYNLIEDFILKINSKDMVYRHNSESKYCQWC